MVTGEIIRKITWDAEIRALQFRPHSNSFVIMDEDMRFLIITAVPSPLPGPQEKLPSEPVYKITNKDEGIVQNDDNMVVDDVEAVSSLNQILGDDSDDEGPKKKLHRLKKSSDETVEGESLNALKQDLGLIYSEDRDDEIEKKEALEHKIATGISSFFFYLSNIVNLYIFF